jgi:hypothetical protein
LPADSSPQSSSPTTPNHGGVESPSRIRLAIGLDWIALLLALVALGVELTGGFRTELPGIRVSVRSVDRAVIAAAMVIGLRVLLSRRVPALGVSVTRWRRLRERLYQPGSDPDLSTAVGSSWRTTLLAALGICAFGAVVLHQQLRHMHSVPDLGDPLFSIWRIGWVYQQLRGDPRALFDGNIFHPEPLTLTYSDSMLLPAVTAAPLLAAGMHPLVTYNLLLLSGFVLSGIAAYLLVVRLTGSARAAFIAGLIFGFYPYHFEHYSHLELQMMHWMPLTMIALHRFVVTLRPGYAIAASVCAAAQLYSSMYYAVFLFFYAIAVMGTILALLRPPLRRLIAPAIAAGILAIALAIPLARPYIAARRTTGERETYVISSFSATASDFLRAHVRSRTYGTGVLPESRHERALFPGVLPITMTAAGLAMPLGLTRVAYVAGLLVAFDASLGFNGLIYPYLHQFFPPVRSLRVPARFSVLVALSLAVLAGFGVKRVIARVPSGRSRVLIFAALTGAAAIDIWPVLQLQPVWAEPPPIYSAVARLDNVVLAEFPVREGSHDFAHNLPFMYFSLSHWAPMLNGYSGFMPRSYKEFAAGVRDFPAADAVQLLKSRGVTHVTVNCALYQSGCEAVLNALDDLPTFRNIAEERWEGSPVRLYELVR